MTDETVQAEAPETQESAVPETSETQTPDEVQESSTPDTEQDGESDQGSEEPEWFQKRINQITAKSKAVERKYEQRATAAERELAELKQRLAEKQPAQAKPKADDFETHEEFVEALFDWKEEQRQSDRDKKAAEQKQHDQQNADLAQAQEDWGRKEQAFAAKHDDYDDVVYELSQRLPRDPNSTAILHQIISHERGPEIIYALGKDTSLAIDLFKTPHTFADQKIAQIAQPKPKPKDLPNPPSGVKTGGGAVKPLAQRSGKEILEHLRGISQ